MGRGSAPGFSRWVSDAGAFFLGGGAYPSPLPLSAAVFSTPVSCMQPSALLFFVIYSIPPEVHLILPVSESASSLQATSGRAQYLLTSSLHHITTSPPPHPLRRLPLAGLHSRAEGRQERCGCVGGSCVGGGGHCGCFGGGMPAEPGLLPPPLSPPTVYCRGGGQPGQAMPRVCPGRGAAHVQGGGQLGGRGYSP